MGIGNDIHKYNGCIETSDIRCHDEPIHVKSKTSSPQQKDTIVIDEHPYWHSFADGFVEGFAFPFAVLFGMTACTPQSNPPIIIYDDTSDEPFQDAGNVANGDADIAIQDATDAALVDVNLNKKEIYSTKKDATYPETTDVWDDLNIDPDVALDVVLDAVEDLASDSVSDADSAVGLDAIDDAADDVPDMVVPDVIADAEDAFQETAADISSDVPAVDGIELPPDDASVDSSIPDVIADVENDNGVICQYFCDVEKSETTDTYSPKGDVVSALCGPLFAPSNSVAAACTNEIFNAMLIGAKGCVAECGFYDNNVILSTAPNKPVAFSTDLFAPPDVTKQSYTITLALQPPKLSDGSSPTLPGFMGSSFVFVFNVKFYEDTGMITWEAQDKDANGKLKGTVQILYEPQDFFFELPGSLDITYTDLSNKKTSYRYPCDQLMDNQGKPNPIVNCEDVTPAPSFWKPVPAGEVFCTADNPLYNTILKAGGSTYFSPMCVYLDTVMTFVLVNGQPEIKTLPFTPEVFSVNYNDLADVALKSSMTIYVKFESLLPASLDLKTSSVEPPFVAGASVALQLDPVSKLTGDPNWKGVGMSVTYYSAVGTTPANLSISYAKGVGLFANYTFPCVIPNASAPIDYSKSPGDYAKCPQKTVMP